MKLLLPFQLQKVGAGFPSPATDCVEDDIDLNAGTIIDGTETIPEVGQRVFDRVLDVASGENLAHAEVHKHREFQIWAERSVSL